MKSIFKSIIISLVIIFCIINVSNAQVKVGANPTTIGTNSSLEVEAANGNKTIVNKTTGQVTIQDGTQGLGKILTSGTNGNASWKTLYDANIPQLVLRAYNPETLQPTGTLYSPPVPLILGDGDNYNQENGYYTIPTSGFYEHNVSMEVMGPFFDKLFAIRTNINLLDGYIRSSDTTWNPRNVGGVKWFNAGEVIYVHTFLDSGNSFTSDYKIRRVSIIIYKR